MKILIVEDDSLECKTYYEEIEAFKEEKSISIEITIKKTLEDALESIKEEIFDVAIVDLNLDNSGKSSGNEVIREIFKKMRIPIYIVSGTISEYDEIQELRGKEMILKKIPRGDLTVREIIEDICKLYSTGITKILNRNGELDKIMNEIFLSYSEDLIKTLKNKSDIDASEKEKIVSRFCATIISEKLKNTSPKYHPCEIYFSPPLKENITTGDIIVNNSSGKKSIILTPACDLEIRKDGHRKVDKVQIIDVLDADNLYTILNIKKTKENFYKDLKSKKIKEYYEFLPLSETRGYVLNFNSMSSIDISEIENEFTRESSLNETFFKRNNL